MALSAYAQELQLSNFVKYKSLLCAQKHTGWLSLFWSYFAIGPSRNILNEEAIGLSYADFEGVSTGYFS